MSCCCIPNISFVTLKEKFHILTRRVSRRGAIYVNKLGPDPRLNGGLAGVSVG